MAQILVMLITADCYLKPRLDRLAARGRSNVPVKALTNYVHDINLTEHLCALSRDPTDFIRGNIDMHRSRYYEILGISSEEFATLAQTGIASIGYINPQE